MWTKCILTTEQKHMTIYLNFEEYTRTT